MRVCEFLHPSEHASAARGESPLEPASALVVRTYASLTCGWRLDIDDLLIAANQKADNQKNYAEEEAHKPAETIGLPKSGGAFARPLPRTSPEPR